jgi:aspartate aminotransferase
VDVNIYKRKRDRLVSGLKDAGYDLMVPPGAFYLFPKSPLADDLRFTHLLKQERILVSPGRAFGAPGYFRISYAVPEAVITGSREGFRRALLNAHRETR